MQKNSAHAVTYLPVHWHSMTLITVAALSDESKSSQFTSVPLSRPSAGPFNSWDISGKLFCAEN